MLFILFFEILFIALVVELIANENFISQVERFFKKITVKKFGGELVVTGSDSIEIEFECDEPHKVLVYFDKICHSAPCDPGYIDHVEWVITRLCCHQHLLKINWDVKGTRTIFWRVFY